MPVMSKDVQELLQRQKSLADARRVWDSHWSDLAEFLLPRRAGFGSAQTAGAKRTEKQFDGTPMQAARGLAASLDGLMKPKTSRWFSIKPLDDDLADIDSVKRWIDVAEERMFNALYDPKARFLQRSAEVDLDLVVFGTGVLFVGENVGAKRLLFRSLHLSSTYIGESADGDIDTVFRVYRLSARQAAQMFPREKLGPKTQEALRDNQPDRMFRFMHAVVPREERDTGKSDRRNMPFASVHIDIDSEHSIAEGGFREFPYVVPRWDTATDEIYGRSPGMLALPDVKTLNQMGKTILRAGHKVVDPPLLIPSEGIVSGPRTWPGGLTPYDADLLNRTGGRPPITPLATGANIPLGREMQNDVREQIFAAFFRNVLQLPFAGPQMTATEILERKAEFMRVIGPTFGRLEADYTGPLVERVFMILQRSGVFPEPPEELRDAEVRFEYVSPLTKAQQQIEAAALQKTAADISAIAANDPSVMDNFDNDRIVREVAGANGLPQRWLKPRADVEAMRIEKAQEQAAMQQADDAERLVAGASDAAEVVGKLGLVPGA
jgi:hypothetical protein